MQWLMYRPFRSEILKGCDLIYPSSIKEMELIKQEYGSLLPCMVVYNCIDQFSLKLNEVNSNDKQYILCAARICPRKNQHILSKVCNEIGERLILVGEANNKDYLNKCLKYKNVSYYGYLQQENLMDLYKSAKLHVLCSFVETPGLSSLEAGACGCNIISTCEGSTEEYFKDMAIYCDPYDQLSIYNSLKTGLNFNKQPMLQKHILENFNTEYCLENLYDSYLNI